MHMMSIHKYVNDLIQSHHKFIAISCETSTVEVETNVSRDILTYYMVHSGIQP